MFNLVTDEITYTDYDVLKIALVCDERVLVQRRIDGNRGGDNPDDMNKYRSLSANIIDTTDLSVCDTADRIISLID
jgi:hypothetical protein